MDREKPRTSGKSRTKQTKTYKETHIFTLTKREKRCNKKEESDQTNKWKRTVQTSKAKPRLNQMQKAN